jgi:serine/threonine protein kinase/formylglycine-generating enzyme required for sulfatase activity
MTSSRRIPDRAHLAVPALRQPDASAPGYATPDESARSQVTTPVPLDAVAETAPAHDEESTRLARPTTAPVRAPDHPIPDMRIGQYHVIRLLGRGGMGEVYLARDLRLGRRVALKRLIAQRLGGNQRFLDEARATARCHHENIVIIYDVGEHHGHPYMVLEYIEGQTLRQWLREQAVLASEKVPEIAAEGAAHPPLPPAQAVALMLPVVRALAYAHERGIVHRDLKPENIMITRSGTIKVLDFGIAKLLPVLETEDGDGRDGGGAAVAGLMSGTAAVHCSSFLGTLSYMSPEQMNVSAIDHRSDLWAVGVMLFELVTGRHPVPAHSMSELLHVANEDLSMPSVREYAPDLGSLAAIIDRCLVKNPRHRIASAYALAAELEAFLDHPAPPQPSGAAVGIRAREPGGRPAPGAESYRSYLPAYAAWARREFGHLSMVGLGGSDLELTLDEVYVRLAFTPQTRDEREPAHGHGHAHHGMLANVDIQEAFALARDRHLFVRGDPGSGKTTALKKMLWSLLDAGSETGFDGSPLGLPSGTVPVFLRLHRLAGATMDRDFGDLLDDALVAVTSMHRNGDSVVPHGFGRWLWERGDVLLLIDGLDEIADPEARRSACRRIEELARAGGERGIYVVVSSRFAAVQKEGALNLDHHCFLHLDARPFDDQQIEALILQWFAAAGRSRSRMRRESEALGEQRALEQARCLIEELRGEHTAKIKELLSTPLLLTLLCLVVERGGQIPERREDFFRECLDALLGRWIAERAGERLLSLDESLDLLEPVAWTMHTGERKYDLGEDELMKLLARPIRRLQNQRTRKPVVTFQRVFDWFWRVAGVLVEYAPGEYGFMHLSLQEYLAARHAARAGEWGRLAEEFGSEWWREVTLLFVGLREHRAFAPLMQRVMESDHLLQQSRHITECLIAAHDPDLAPFLTLIGDRAAPAARRATALRLVRDQADENLIAVASEVALESPAAAEELRLLAEQVEAKAPAIMEERWLEQWAPDVLLACHPADQRRACEMASTMRGWTWSVDIASSLRSETSPWQRARAFVVLAGAGGPSPWQVEATRKCLVEMVRRGVPLVTAMTEGMEAGRLPLLLQTRPHVTLGSDLLRTRLPALLAGMLGVAAPGPVAAEAVGSASAAYAGGQSFVDETTGLRFLWVPGGTFTMGADDLWYACKPPHRVQVSPFWLAETPVTNRQYELFLAQTRHEEPALWRDRRYNQPEQPAVGVSWRDAKAFCQWLGEISGHTVDLPTEAQWEFAARSDDHRNYPWGDEEPDPQRAHFGKDGENDAPLAVGSLPAGQGPFGHLDLAGNALEWCQDVWDELAYRKRGELTVDPSGPTGNDDHPDHVRACRGGAFGNEPINLRSACRYGRLADGRYRDIVFRVAVLPASIACSTSSPHSGHLR